MRISISSRGLDRAILLQNIRPLLIGDAMGFQLVSACRCEIIVMCEMRK
jgi:hypothetical protein